MNKKKSNSSYYSENVNNIHEQCADDRLKEYQKIATHDYKTCDFVKIKIKTGEDDFEYMWIKVIESSKENKTVRGTLSNDPLIKDLGVKYGDEFSFGFDKISELLTDFKL
jgi:hypothetical protein